MNFCPVTVRGWNIYIYIYQVTETADTRRLFTSSRALVQILD